MRLSVLLLIFLLLLNGWAGLLQEYGVDDHLGITAETGDPQALENASSKADELSGGSGGITNSITGIITSFGNSLSVIIKGVNPAAQMLSNIAPPGIAQSLIVWFFGITNIIVAIDLINFFRGVG
jgi:hypothetical protein